MGSQYYRSNSWRLYTGSYAQPYYSTRNYELIWRRWNSQSIHMTHVSPTKWWTESKWQWRGMWMTWKYLMSKRKRSPNSVCNFQISTEARSKSTTVKYIRISEWILTTILTRRLRYLWYHTQNKLKMTSPGNHRYISDTCSWPPISRTSRWRTPTPSGRTGPSISPQYGTIIILIYASKARHANPCIISHETSAKPGRRWLGKTQARTTVPERHEAHETEHHRR